jgi:thioredoxin 1
MRGDMTMKLFFIALVFLVSGMTGCASHLQEIKNPNIPFEKQYFSIHSPQDGDWMIVGNETPYGAYFGKRQGETHSFTAYANESERAPTFASPEEFQIYYKTQLSHNQYPERYRLIKFESSRDNRFGEYCIKFSRIAEDKGAPNSPRGTSLLLKTTGYMILLPQQAATIEIFYSERGLKEEMLPDFDAKAEEFFKTFRIKTSTKATRSQADGQGRNTIETEWRKFAGKPMELNELEFRKMVFESSLPVLVEFYAPWCEYCREFTPIFAELAKEYKDKINFATVNIDENESLAAKMGIRSPPTFLLVNNGDILKDWVGTRGGKDAVIKKIQSGLNIK